MLGMKVGSYKKTKQESFCKELSNKKIKNNIKKCKKEWIKFKSWGKNYLKNWQKNKDKSYLIMKNNINSY